MMIYAIKIICLLCAVQDSIHIQIPKINTPPIIDGNIDSIWYHTDSISTFIQCTPEEGKPPTESTVAYICCDANNIYVAFKCFDSEPQKIDIRVASRDDASGDCVFIMFDTFGDKTTAYEFSVNAAGVQSDDKTSQDGRVTDRTWDGVWYSAAKVTDYGYNVEMKIPFKILRFNPNLTEWGCNFLRFIPRKNENTTWAPIKQAEGMRVSRCGLLEGLHPDKQGLNLEIYPVGIVRYEGDSARPQVGLDIGWAFTASQLSVTTCPDFAQIEADPYNINLSKYETYFDERRPFFIEKQEVFTTPINLFYSRRVGKKLYTGEEVPIIGGVKYTGTYQKVNFGFLSAYTDTVSTEPKTLYSAGRVKMGILHNSDIGVIYSEARDETNIQKVFGMDGTFRTQELELASQLAKSDSGHAEVVNLNVADRKFLVNGRYENYDQNFDVSRIGYVPWRGRTLYYLLAGPSFFNMGPFYNLSIGVGGGKVKEAWEPVWGSWIQAYAYCTFKNMYGINLTLYKNKSYEMNRLYNYQQLQCNYWTNYSEPVVFSGTSWYSSEGFNYRRGYFGAMATNNLGGEWKINPSFTFSLNLFNSLEWKPSGELEPASWVLRPIVEYAITKDLHFRTYVEPNTDNDIYQFNALLSYNFRPKSWLYIALNETRDNSEDKMELVDRIAVAKVRYLFFF